MRKCTLPILPVLVAAVIAEVILPGGPAHAQSKLFTDPKDQEIELLKTEVKQLESRVNTLEGLDQKVKVIDRKLEVQEETEQQHALEMPIVSASDQGFSLSSPNNAYRLNFGALVQGDGRFFTSGSDKNVSSTFYLNRVRPILSGTVDKWYDFQITPDFGQGKGAVLQDAWVNAHYYPQGIFQIGKFKAPFDLERLQQDRDLEFSERSEITNLAVNRDTGVELFSNTLLNS